MCQFTLRGLVMPNVAGELNIGSGSDMSTVSLQSIV